MTVSGNCRNVQGSQASAGRWCLAGRGSQGAVMTLGVQPEVGQLRQVIVRRPGLELSRLTPQNVGALLFDDVMWAKKAKGEHDAFAEALGEKGVRGALLRVAAGRDARSSVRPDIRPRPDLHAGDTRPALHDLPDRARSRLAGRPAERMGPATGENEPVTGENEPVTGENEPVTGEKEHVVDLHGRNLLKEIDLSQAEFRYLVDLAGRFRTDKRGGRRSARLTGRNIALIFEQASTRTRSAFEVAAHDEGGHVTYLGPEDSHLGHKESVKDAARVLGRMFDGIEFRGFAQESADILGAYAGVPVWNGLTDQWHPTQMLADILTMREHAGKPLDQVSYCYLGDARNNTANSLLVTGALLGLDVRVCAPESLWPGSDVQSIAAGLAAASGAKLTLTSDVSQAVAGADFLYTDVWLSMGEPESQWDARIDLLLPYQVNAQAMAATGNPAVKFMHCLPALHDRETGIGRLIYDRRGLAALEVTDQVFESAASVVFDQAENRMHTIKALMVATVPMPS